jgi:5'(3')-deoxyribonucleotidase
MIQDKNEKFDSHDRTIFVDLDGVLCDFHGHFKELFGWNPGKSDDSDDKTKEKVLADQKMWEQINSYGKSRFFEELTWVPGSKAMWAFIIDNFVNVKILSALGKSDIEDGGITRKGKIRWLEHHLPGLKPNDIILVTNKHKKRHYSKPGSIIIDDTPVIIDEWNAKGGIGIFFTNAMDVTEQLKKYVYGETK